MEAVVDVQMEQITQTISDLQLKKNKEKAVLIDDIKDILSRTIGFLEPFSALRGSNRLTPEKSHSIRLRQEEFSVWIHQLELFKNEKVVSIPENTNNNEDFDFPAFVLSELENYLISMVEPSLILLENCFYTLGQLLENIDNKLHPWKKQYPIVQYTVETGTEFTKARQLIRSMGDKYRESQVKVIPGSDIATVDFTVKEKNADFDFSLHNMPPRFRINARIPNDKCSLNGSPIELYWLLLNHFGEERLLNCKQLIVYFCIGYLRSPAVKECLFELRFSKQFIAIDTYLVE